MGGWASPSAALRGVPGQGGLGSAGQGEVWGELHAAAAATTGSGACLAMPALQALAESRNDGQVDLEETEQVLGECSGVGQRRSG